MKLILITFNIISFQSIICKRLLVETSSGLVKGSTIHVLNKRVNQFLGIPFAEPPIGDLRFAKPKPIRRPLPDVIDATKPKNYCYQRPMGPESWDKFKGLPQSEDCLVLNVWSHDFNNWEMLKPVMFFVHGGGFLKGSIFKPQYNGSVLAAQNVVFVSANYRLGPLGFLYGDDPTAPGNVAFYDQLLALKWVRKNIRQFGGDKDKITIMGQSAGGWSVSLHLLSPMFRGLFRRAIIQSGTVMFNRKRPVLSKSDALDSAKQVAKHLNCDPEEVEDWLECLRKADPRDLVRNFNVSFTTPLEDTDIWPVSAQNAFDNRQYNKDLELLIGVNRDEATTLVKLPNTPLTKRFFKWFVHIVNQTFHMSSLHSDVRKVYKHYMNGVSDGDSVAIKQRAYDLFSDIVIRCPTYHFAKQYAKQSVNRKKVFFYEVTHVMDGTPEWLGVYHESELKFIFGLPLTTTSRHKKVDLQFTREMIEHWTNFVKYGNPSSLFDKWQPFLNNGKTYVKNLNPFNRNKYFIDPFANTCDGVWSEYFQ